MFNVPQSMLNEIMRFKAPIHEELLTTCRLNLQSCALINGKQSIMPHDIYVEHYKNFTWDIEIKTSPLEAFIPVDTKIPIRFDLLENLDDKPVRTREFIINREIPEYERLAKRITLDELQSTLNPTHPVLIALERGRVKFEDIVDDIFINLCLSKFIDGINTARIQMFSNMTPVIDYVTDNIGYDDLKRYIQSTRINPDKLEKYEDKVFFEQDYKKICEFYYGEKAKSPVQFDLDNLIERLITNIVSKSDIYIILAIYLTASFAVSDFKRDLDSPAVRYVTDVLSIL